MQFAWLLPVSVAAATGVLISIHTPSADTSRASASPIAEPSFTRGQTFLTSIERWEDSLMGLSLGFPAGWTAMQLPDVNDRAERLEPGYVIGFESPLSDGADVFADYLLIEILPGDDSGQFETDGSQRRSVSIAGRLAWRDSLKLDGHRIGDEAVDLSVQQAGFQGLGYTVGLYVVGEQSASAYLNDVFEVLIQTFTLDGEPFQII